MADNPIQPQGADDLQFTTAETDGASAAVFKSCAACGQPITSTYYAIGEAIVCPSCSVRATAPPAGSTFGRLIKATLLGLVAGLIGALIWFAIRRLAQLEIGLVAILVGFMVGKAVRKGSGNLGGRAYQVLAVLLTYCCIAANYMPDILEAFYARWQQDRAASAIADAGGDAQATPVAQPDPGADPGTGAPAAAPARPVGVAEMIFAYVVLAVVAFAIALAAPFLAGAQNLIGLLIIGFALWEAWRFNAKWQVPISGPYQIMPGAVS